MERKFSQDGWTTLVPEDCREGNTGGWGPGGSIWVQKKGQREAKDQAKKRHFAETGTNGKWYKAKATDRHSALLAASPPHYTAPIKTEKWIKLSLSSPHPSKCLAILIYAVWVSCWLRRKLQLCKMNEEMTWGTEEEERDQNQLDKRVEASSALYNHETS